MPTAKKIGSTESFIFSHDDILKMGEARSILLRELSDKSQQAKQWEVFEARIDETSFKLVSDGLVRTLSNIVGDKQLCIYIDCIVNLRHCLLPYPPDPSSKAAYEFFMNSFIENIKMLTSGPNAIFTEELDDPDKLLSDTQKAFNHALLEPVPLNSVWKIYGYYWAFKEFIYTVPDNYSEMERKLLILEDFDRERKYFERLHQKFYSERTSRCIYKRERIPESVRVEVWNRDGGKCARCGSRENLEYDHIVPVSRGGSNTARNIELLCEKCNRSKGNRIE